MTYTAEMFLNAPRFYQIAADEAVKVLAKTHGKSESQIMSSMIRSKRLQSQRKELMRAAAEESAKRWNEKSGKA